MTKLEFAEKVAEAIRKKEEGFNIDVIEVPKNNETLVGIKRLKEGDKCSPIVYLKNESPDYYNNSNCIRDIEKIADGIIDAFCDAEKYDLSNSKYRNEILSTLTNWERCKNKIYLGAVKRNGNEEFLKNTMWYPLCDLAVYAFVSLTRESSVYLNKSMVEKLQVTEDVVWEAAKENMLAAVVDYKICDNTDIMSILEDEFGEDAIEEERNSFSVVTTANGYKGAGVIACKTIMDKMCEKYGNGEDIIIMPSSIHEILVTENNADLIQYVNEIVCSANCEAVDVKEQLSDHAYMYSKKHGLYF